VKGEGFQSCLLAWRGLSTEGNGCSRSVIVVVVVVVIAIGHCGCVNGFRQSSRQRAGKRADSLSQTLSGTVSAVDILQIRSSADLTGRFLAESPFVRADELSLFQNVSIHRFQEGLLIGAGSKTQLLVKRIDLEVVVMCAVAWRRHRSSVGHIAP